MGQIVKQIPFPHESFGPFISCIKDYFNTWVYPFKYTVTGVYEKAIQVIEQKKTSGDWEKQGTLSPLLVFTPQLTEPVQAVNLHWKYSNLHPYQVRWNQKPFLEYHGNLFNIITRRMTGMIDFKVFCDSMMEMHDIYLAIIDGFRGLNKISILPRISQYLVVSDDIKLYVDEKEYIAIDWTESNIALKFFPGINKDKWYLPLNTKPQITLQSISDSSSFYGGDGLPDFSLQGTLGFEIELPVMMTVETHARIMHIDAEISTTYANNPGIVGIHGDEHFAYLNLMFAEILEDDGTTSSRIGTCPKEYHVEIDTTGTVLEYPYAIPDIPWEVSKNNTLIFIYSEPQWDWDVQDEHTIRMNSGPVYENSKFDMQIYKFVEAECGGWGKP